MDAHQASFTVDYPETVSYLGYTQLDYEEGISPAGKKSCSDESDPENAAGLKSIKCELGNPFSHAEAAVTIRLRFKKNKSLLFQEQTSFFLTLNTTSEQTKLQTGIEYALKIKVNPRVKILTENLNEQIGYKMVTDEGRIATNTIQARTYDALDQVIGPKV